ncbi:hypothetical protein OBBRIDRAFT_727636 [Obba rivulosa]|uniref:BRCT domain-containing protein n=1 Tax=Obba rivulosa TaxID=1052685 RepID=A0A8E2DKZ3_9APHY|nr:hypothetical protein OBBRIDRAFT_727636 [Obba rivulosa]
MRGRVTLKASKQTSLPVVQGSPVKGGADREPTGEDVLDVPYAQPLSTTEGGSETAPGTVGAQPFPEANNLVSSTQAAGQDVTADLRRVAHRERSSRRASLASQRLAQSISGGPLPYTPPTLPPGPMTSSGNAKENAVLTGESSLATVTNGAQSAPATLTRTRGSGARVSAHGRNSDMSPGQDDSDSKAGGGALNVLSDCTIFVDVRTDDGDDAGALFTDMLKGMGAKILQRVGQTCTHVVYKNGLMSTITRYRLLHDPRPLVVGIAWVVECVEQRTRVDETKFLITLDGVNVAGTNKRRRSMLPKLLGSDPEGSGTPPQHAHSPADRNADHPSYVISPPHSREYMADVEMESLPPLEKARRRKSLLFGPHSMHA